MKGFSLLSVAASALFFVSTSVLADEATLLGEYAISFASESVEYDSVNDRFYYGSAFGQSISYIDASDIAGIVNGSVTAVDNAFDFKGVSPYFMAGMWTNGVTLYVNSFAGGVILEFDIESMSYVDNITVMYNASEDIGATPNGMCIDPSDEDTLYITDAGIWFSADGTESGDTGYGMIYKVTLSTGEYMKMYDNSETLIHPNGCIVDDDGVMYMVEFSYEQTNNLIVWDTSDDSWSFYEVESRGDGITITDDGDLYVTAFAANANDTHGFYQMVWENDDYTRVSVVDDLVAPADICYDNTHGVIVIPSLDTTFTDNSLTFVYVGGSDETDSSTTNTTATTITEYEDSALVYLPSVMSMMAFAVAALVTLC